MRTAETYEELKALPFWVVVRTKRGAVRERGPHSGDASWSQMGSEHAVGWEDEDFPVRVLWSYADEIAPPPLDFSKYQPYQPGTGIITTQHQGTPVQ